MVISAEDRDDQTKCEAHLPGSLDSLAPRDGIYSRDRAGSVPAIATTRISTCQRTQAVPKKEASFSMVIPAGRQISDFSESANRVERLRLICCKDLLDAPKHTAGRASVRLKNVDGRPVPARKYIRVSYTCGENWHLQGASRSTLKDQSQSERRLMFASGCGKAK